MGYSKRTAQQANALRALIFISFLRKTQKNPSRTNKTATKLLLIEERKKKIQLKIDNVNISSQHAKTAMFQKFISKKPCYTLSLCSLNVYRPDNTIKLNKSGTKICNQDPSGNWPIKQ